MTELRKSFGFPLSVAVHTDVGRVRNNNEDSSGHAWLDDGSLFVMVADGMGGHEAGEVASGLAVQVVQDVVSRDLETDPRERLYNALLEANSSILDEARRSGKHGMGTTGICAVLRGAEVHVGLVGDSRCYQIRKGHMIWRTVDHTRVQMLVDSGEIDEEEARVHPEAGMLTRALGHNRMADGRPLVPDVQSEPITLQENDALLLCSDGLHDLIEDWEIGRQVAGKDAAQAAQALVELACERGGHDNVTVAVVVAGKRAGEFDAKYSPPPKPSAEATYSGWSGDTEETESPSFRATPLLAPTMAPRSEMVDEVPAKSGSNKTMLLAAGAVAVLGGGGLLLVVALIVVWKFFL
jgi:serine/threonine protein phosphatase PrpC